MRDHHPPISKLLAEDILFGRLRPRERLVEDDLVARFGATRHAVRTALQQLAVEGLVIHLQNRGAQVRDFSQQEVEEITTLRELLHGEAARRFPLPAAEIVFQQLARRCDAHADAVERQDLASIHRENEAFHQLFYDACGNRYLSASIAQHARLSMPFRCHAMADPVLARQARDEHRAMLAAIGAGNREVLVTLCVEHTKFAKRTYRRLQGWTADPVETVSAA